MFGNPLWYSLMSLLSIFLAAFSISSSLLPFNNNTNDIIKYRQVLATETGKYKTLEITATPKNKFYFVPTNTERPIYKKVTIVTSITPSKTIQITHIPKTATQVQIQNKQITQAQTPTIIPTLTLYPTIESQNLNKEDFILNEINNYRVSKGLSKSQKDSNTCNFAKLRAQEISINFNHDGFSNRINDKTLPYPSYSSITENISMNSDYKQVVSKWLESPPHTVNIEKDTPFICIGNSGDYYTMEGWKP